MEDKHLHIISFNIPYPPDYGGIIDVYYKMKALKSLGVKVHLHCFQYGRSETEELQKLCYSVNYYPRKKFYQSVFSSVPYIVGSRQSDELLSTLQEDKHPILFEGLHTCYYLSHPALQGRKKAVKMHNIEWEYYRSLGKAEKNFFKRFYFFSESKKLKSFEHELKHADFIFGVSPNDTENLKKLYPQTVYLPVFHQNEVFKVKAGKGDYALYHGNLSVVENNQAAMYLLHKVFADLDMRFIIAGKKPLSSLKKEVRRYENVELVADPTDSEMMELISNAHINILPTFQATGIKLKMLTALYNGRFCLVNSRMVQNTGLEPLCIIENDSTKIKEKIKKLFEREMDQQEIEERKKLLDELFSNKNSANLIVKCLYPQIPQ
ncbi:MAG: glycosyltransferase family 1 protein [Chitinophagales bacterium]|nr:glycosyltransferase family 1 protein [Chitinophagales bacterium]